MMLLVKLAWRSLWRNRRRTLITLSSMAFGLGLAVFFVALGDGFYAKMISDAVRMQAGHLTLEHPAYRDAPAVDLAVPGVSRLRRAIEALPGVERTKTLVVGQGVARSSSGAVGVAILGIEPSREVASGSPIVTEVTAGRYLEDGDEASALVGAFLAKQLRLDVGRKLVLTTNDVRGDLVEELVRVKGIFEVGAPEADGHLVQVPLGFARRLYAMGGDEATQLGVILADPRSRDRLLGAIRRAAGGGRVAVLPWEKVMPDLAAYVQIDGASNLILQAIILFLVMFTIFNTILMSVLEREREFAVLLALGTPPRMLEAQVLLETVFVAALGCAAGLGLGGLAAWWAQIRGIDLSGFLEEGTTISGFAVDAVIRAHLTARLLAVLGGIVFSSTLLLGLHPMRRAARVPVAQALR